MEVQQLDNQSRQPKKGDLITYFSHDFDVWLHFKIISKVKARSKYAGYYNICYLDIDREDNGIYFNMDPFWSVQEEDMEKREPDKQPKLLRYTSDCNSVGALVSLFLLQINKNCHSILNTGSTQLLSLA